MNPRVPPDASPLRKKLSNFLHTQHWKGASNYVAKRYIESVDRDVYFEDVRLQMEAKLWGEEYNRHKPPKQVRDPSASPPPTQAQLGMCREMKATAGPITGSLFTALAAANNNHPLEFPCDAAA